MKRVGYMINDARPLSPEENAAWQWLAARKELESARVSLEAIAQSPEEIQRFDMLWFHDDSSLRLPAVFSDASFRSILQSYVRGGGALMLSLLGAQAVSSLGFESNPPNVVRKGAWEERCWAEGYPDIRGYAGFLGHPVFEGLRGAVFTWNPTPESPCAGAYYEAPQVPLEGRVVAVERQYIKLNDERRLIWEYQVGKGKVLAVGCALFFGKADDRFRPHLELLAANCLHSLLEAPSGRRTYWDFTERSVREIRQSSAPVSMGSVSLPEASSGLSIMREPREVRDSVFDVGGRRMLVMGRERTGIQEIWCHPFRLVRNVRIGVLSGPGHPRWLHEFTPKITVRPESVTRAFDVGEVRIEETTVSSPKDTAAAVHLSVNATHPLDLVISCSSDLRLMWPYSEHATGSLAYGWDENLKAFIIHNGEGGLCSVVGSSRTPDEVLGGRFSALTVEQGRLAGTPSNRVEVGIGMRFTFSERTAELLVTFAGSDQGPGEAVAAYRRASKHPASLLSTQVEHFRHLFNTSTLVTSPDDRFNDAYRWALAALDRFMVQTPALGTSLVAGFGTTERGWDGGHAVSGRPGYAWYFGRDAVWSAFALLDAGQFWDVKDVLTFLGVHQDVTGKILHELTTSGHAHYDAADATPLYCILLGRYLRSTGDAHFVREQFDRLVRAIEFCQRTDTDHDGLIENTNVGHGWVEGGKLFPVHTEIYLAACWAEALTEAAHVAEAVGKPELGHSWAAEASRVRSIVAQDFWNPGTGFYNFAKNADRSYNSAKTVLPAVAAYFQCVEPGAMQRSMREYASAEFSADWGVRIIGRSDPMFSPSGYHSGSVWPLFTGWVSLAEFALRRPLQGFSHLKCNLDLYKPFAAGYAEEVLHGERFEPAGVCSHQAWSESMAIQPALEGLVGIAVDGRLMRLGLRPFLPATWDSLQVSNIRVGETPVDFHLERKRGRMNFSLRTPDKAPLAVSVQILLPLGSVVRTTHSGDRTTPVERTVRSYADSPTIAFTLKENARGFVEFTEGVSLESFTVHPAPGSASVGLRCLEERMEGDAYELLIEAPADRENVVALRDPGMRIIAVQGSSRWDRAGERVLVTLPRGEPHSSAGYGRSLVRVELEHAHKQR